MSNIITPNVTTVHKRSFFSFFVAVLFVLTNQIGFAQVSTYGFSETVSSYTALSTSSVAYAAPWDDHVSGSAFLAPLGFTFVYDGTNQTQCYISPNGFISFGSVQPASANYLPLSTATSYTGGGAISALGMDLTSGTPTDNIVYSTIGSIPNRTFVVQWTNARRKSGSGNFNFQIRLHETTNIIDISYGTCAPDATVLSTQVGIRGVTNDFLQGEINNRLQTGSNVNSTWLGKTTTGTANSSTVRTSITEYPNNGLLYTYTPSANCLTPSASPTAFVIGGTSVTSTSFVGNSFTAATPAPTNYLIIRSTVNITPTNIDIPNRFYWSVNDVISGMYTVISNSNSTSFTQTGLTPNTMYYYWVIPYNAGCLGGPFYKMNAILAASKATCLTPTASVSSSNADGNSFTASWSAVTGATDYQIDVSTSNTFATTLPAYTNASTAGATSLVVSGLNPLTTYYFRVRAVGISCGTDSGTGSASTLCGAYSIPYSQNFDTTPVATLPNCFTVSNDNLDAITWQVQNTLAASSPNAYHLTTSSGVNSDDWFFTPGLNLTGGVTYRLKFKYNTANTGSSSENLRVRLGSSATVANMNSTLLNLSNFVNSAYQTAIVDFTPVINDIYYLGFQGFSFANQSKILIDDISVIVSPTCFEPTNLDITTVGVTTATLTWNASVPAPSNGYNYYVSTSSTTPSNSVTPTGSVGAGVTTANITGLLSATLYYVWVRGNCGGTDRSEWSLLQSFTTDCDVPAYLTVTNGTLCGGGSTTLTATGSSGSTIEWFSDSSAATAPLATGTSFVTPTLYSTTTYYARSKVSGGLQVVGPISPILQGGSLGVQSNTVFISFSIFTTTVFQSIDIYPMVSGQSGVIYILNAANTVVGTTNYVTNVSGGNTPQTINLSVSLTPGNYFLNMATLPAGGLVVNVDNGQPLYASTVCNITGNDYDNTFYLYAYNWKLSNICKSLITPVTANITPPPPISFSASSATICYGDTTPLITVSGYGAYNNFTWSPSTGISGSMAAGFTFNPTATTTYSLTAQQTSGGLCASLITFTVTVKGQPPAISLSPATATICQGVTQPLVASLASPTPVIILSEDFNAATNNWTTINNSAGGTPALAAWTLTSSPYFASSVNWNRTFSSNDNSQFYFTDSDAQGPPSSNVTKTYLVSPTINLAGYTSATLSFWQYLRYIGGNRARVEASIDGGTTWIAPPALTQTASQGASNSFVNTTVNLSSLIGNSNVKIRFYYDATYDYGWAIDNVTISGNLALEVVWSPATDLYFDPAATTPYIAGTPTGTVYAKPNSTITYTGTALGSNGCYTSNTSVITVIPNVVTGTLSGNQTICGNTPPSNLVLSGYTGTIVRWEYANDAAFTSGLTTIANTTATLSSALIGTFTGSRYYRVVLQSGSCPAVYSGSVVVNFASTTWNGSSWSNGVPNSSLKAIFNGNYTSTGDLQACGVEVLSGTVFISTGHTLTVQNDVKVTSGTLTFDNNASLVQVNTLDANGNTIANTGNITYIRATTPMFKYDYTYWSTPVSPQNLFNLSPLSPANLFLQFNSATNSWQYITSPSTTTMVPAKGYIFRAPTTFPTGGPATPQVFIANFVGVPNTGTITIPVTGGASQFNLLGNPYPSALSADAFLLDSGNSSTLSGTIYLWTHNTPLNAAYQYSGSDYAIYNYLGGVGTGTAATNIGLNVSVPTGKIASGQGFFIKGLTSGTATFKNSMRIAGNNDHFFKMTTPAASMSSFSDIEKHRYWLNITNTQGALKQALIGYAETATLGLDRLFDGEMVDVGNVISLYTMVDNTKLSIQGRPLPFDVSDIIPLGYKSTINSTYAITLADFDGLFVGQDIYLEDKDLNVVQNLKAGPYTFTTGIGTFENRFVLKYTDSTLGNHHPDFNENAVLIYKSTQNNFVINTGAYIMDNVKVFDIRGRLLLEKRDVNSGQTTFDAGSTNEVLLVQITTTDGIIVTKKVVR
ncbi:MAG TPA: choice-of-anchor J domain-containing protein [Flavobacterium sp.]|uniref:fibronectin type III domain-containing protein n=1 Tax=Flavobacterium sp. TaxID=239 RepID=UPI002C25C279|nr:choice-of-anchor J domain-containing protein [Flavobacterium sp.]HNP32853.1 choice-of-anchor J domain-containing protein [Flavobacterium sp.]